MYRSAPVWVEVDDDHAIRWVLSRALSKAGIECRLFEEAESVLKALEDSAPMVLVSDIRMPGVSGWICWLVSRPECLTPRHHHDGLFGS